MKVIFKYDIGTPVYVPNDSQVLCVKLQNGVGRVWVLQDSEAEDIKYNYIQLEVIGTGQGFDDTGKKYIGTYEDGSFIKHVFQIV